MSISQQKFAININLLSQCFYLCRQNAHEKFGLSSPLPHVIHMKNETNIHTLCIETFSAIVSSVCHDLKNNLAIINESVGLLSDFATMMEDDTGIPSKRVTPTVSSINRQVVRADTIIKNLSRFAHSNDIPLSATNIKETLSLIKILSHRKAAAQEHTVTIICDNGLNITTAVIIFETVIYRILCHLYDISPPKNNFDISAATTCENIVITFAPEQRLSCLEEVLLKKEPHALATQLEADMEIKNNAVELTLPLLLMDRQKCCNANTEMA